MQNQAMPADIDPAELAEHAEQLATALADLLALLPAADSNPKFLPARRVLAAYRAWLASSVAGGATGWDDQCKLSLLQSFQGLAPLQQAAFIAFAQRLMADDPAALQLATAVANGELSREAALAQM